MSIWKNEKFWCVVGGAVGSAIAKKILKAPKPANTPSRDLHTA